MKLIKFVLIVLIILCTTTLEAQNINGKISTSVYAFERAHTLTDSEMFLRAYETLVLNINKNKFSLRTRINFETNFSNELVNDPRLRLYNFYFEARKLFDVATIKVGRQPIFNQVAGGLFDGANIKLNAFDFVVQGYFGGNVPNYQKFALTDNIERNNIFGGKLSYNGFDDIKLGISYVDKNYLPTEYEAQRLDINLNPITVLIQERSNQFRYGSATVSYNGLMDANAKVDYDFNFSTLSKAEVSGRYEAIENLGVNLYYNYRAPKIRYNSIFSVFNYANTQEIEGGLDYKFSNNLSIIGKFGNVQYEDASSQRFTLGVNSPYGGLSYRQTLGYAGELSSLSLYSARTLFNGLLTPSVGLGYTTYKLSEDDLESNDIISVLAGVNVRPWRTLSFDLQGQFFDNKIYKNDLRLFFKINYWFNTNLDLL
ncbi:MAG: hypothetical protein GY936_19610 [Ignavibacteriae bacterium]|nr:hypothetical protein [Ignavibacteriota bacterium]